MVQKLLYKDILQPGRQVRLTRATLTPARPKSLHDHDFFELFWVLNGTIRHHLTSGAETLKEGSVVFIRPGQEHALQGRGEHALVVSLCIHPDTVKSLAKRHPNLKGHLFWSHGDPVKAHRDIRQMTALNQGAVQLENSPCDTLATEAFLLPLCAELTAASFAEDVPVWLANACAAAKSPDVFRDGSAGLVAIAGKAHSHVSRMMRKHLGQTPSDYVNNIRMQHAARALTTDDQAISEIAADCGIPNMSHFHKLFRAAYGLTPLQYRQKFQRQVAQPT
ncbi:helix-turn-helix transcriptional regulator [Roseobacter sp. CCS2]|uniref:helix-turn-helix transcriptional regulator n=1 Tax=Roseobacter sp. CCS2 TaxID=391593 RepID=UPI0000F4042D|nr:AraC family transcriptional regulator [Roseobacter sp. CCS2]EBA13511.1 transcriptional regulator, AraC family protein [Roseobacter sp. CCS2]